MESETNVAEKPIDLEHQIETNSEEKIGSSKKRKKKFKENSGTESEDSLDTTDSEDDELMEDKSSKKNRGERSKSQCSVCGKMYTELSSHMRYLMIYLFS